MMSDIYDEQVRLASGDNGQSLGKVPASDIGGSYDYNDDDDADDDDYDDDDDCTLGGVDYHSANDHWRGIIEDNF
jgi:hypothetical protein